MVVSPLATDPLPEPSQCANCGAAFDNEWCPACGQHRRGSKRIGLREVAEHVTKDVLNFDTALLRTIRDLSLRPGPMCRDYVAGRRKRYLNPLAYYLLVGGVMLLASSLLKLAVAKSTPAADDPLESYGTYLLLASLLPLAVQWRWPFRRSGHNFSVTLVFTLYITGHFLWIELLVLSPIDTLVRIEMVTWPAFALTWVGYTVWAACGFFNENVWWTLGKILVSLLGWFLVVGLCVGPFME
jgi:hypothetical protein